MSMNQFPLKVARNSSRNRKQILMILLNVDPLNPDVRFVPEHTTRDGCNPFDVDLTTVTKGGAEQVSIRVVILQDNLTFMPGDTDITAGCELSKKFLRRLSPPSSIPAKDLEFLVEPLGADDPELEFNLGLIASGTCDAHGKEICWTLPFILDPKVRNL